jgi:signal transduction histidine kinase
MPTRSGDRAKAAAADARRTRWIAIAALYAPLLLLLVVAFRTWNAERRYAEVTHGIVHDYAGIAAWQYARRANIVLHDEAMSAFSGIAGGHQRMGAGDRLQSPDAIVAARATKGGAFLDHARFAFTYDVGSGQIDFAGGFVDAETHAMLERRLLEVSRKARSGDEPHRVLFDSAGTASHMIALWTLASTDRPMHAAYGVVSDPRALAQRFNGIVREADLLPSARLREPVDESDIAVRLTRSDGGLVFASTLSPGSTAATDTATLQSGELHTTIDLAPRLANALLVGGAPASQLPSLALMIIVAAVLAAIGLVHERRTRELARVRGRFVANVSHELRTPLAQISMFAETLAMGRERNVEEGRHFASIVFAEARRLTAMVESVLRFSRLESNHETLRVELVDVGREISDAVETFAPVANASGVTITMKLDDGVTALLDRAAFRQILLNLLDNAVKHGGRGTSVLVTGAQRGGEVVIVVDDSGPGVPESWRERVFDPFVRAEQGKVPGAGIGLAVVRDLVAAHGGRVWIEQSPGRGARFIVAMQAAEPQARVKSENTVETPA